MTTANEFCRVYQHMWQPYDAKKVGRGWEADLICKRCGTHRIDKISAFGEVTSRRYNFGDGYLRKGQGRMTGDMRQKLRISVLIGQTK